MERPRLILIAGATGYVGSHLLAELERRGERVRCLARRPEKLRAEIAASTEIVAGDVLLPETLGPALTGVDVAFYLVHSMESGRDFEADDRAAARNFAAAAHAAAVRRIVYVGGLGEDGGGLSAHLRSRHEVGQILGASGVETIELRASIVLGSGSLSFEMIRALVERLPVMITPRWVDTPCQPIAISDLLRTLLLAMDLSPGASRTYEVGGPERVSYGELMREYARARGLHRLLIPVPVLTPRLSSLWLGLVTPYYARVGRKLVESLKNPTVLSAEGERESRDAFGFTPRGVREAVAEALAADEASGTRIVDSRARSSPESAVRAWRPIQRIGGGRGWYYANWLWRLRAGIDRVLGGDGMAAGRVHPEQLACGDPIDFWTVVALEPGRRLRLAANMKLPGRAWLEFEVTPSADGAAGSVIRQTATFDPRGLPGLLYWWALLPVHRVLFDGMLAAIVAAGQEP